MAGIVIDASALAAMVFGESTAEEVALRVNGRPMSAPALPWFEMANVCLNKIKRNPGEAEQYIALLNEVSTVGIEAVAVNHQAVVALAWETGLTSYDASYLWLARHLDVELVTLDEEMRQAAEA